MVSKKIMLIKPNLETDAVWDPRRTCSYLGMWHLASKLKEKKHEVRYLDEVVRNDGLNKIKLFKRELKGNKIVETPLNISCEDFQKQKMNDFNVMTSEQFVNKYSAFKEGETIIRTMARTGNSHKETLEEVSKMNPDFIGIPLISTANYLPATRLAKVIKKKFRKTKIMFGGQHITANPNQFLKENPYVDFVFSGDAINTIEDVIEGKIKDKIVYGGFQEMNKFTLLNPKILEENNYPVNPTYTYPTNGRKSVDYMFTKGCFRKCNFCVAGSQKGNHVTAVSYDKVDEQLKIFKENGIEEIVIQDDAYLWDKKHIKAHLPNILKLMKKYDMYWQNNGGVEFEMLDDFATNEIVEYNKSGKGKVTALYIPFNPREWNKDKSATGTMALRYQNSLENMKKLKEAGIYIFTSGIIGTPEQTKEIFNEDIKANKELIKKGYLNSALALSATMLPATKWYDTNGHNIVNKKDYAGFSLFTTHHATPNLTPKEIETEFVRWYKELGKVQETYKWGTAFPNAEMPF